jgi:hypothetical protein
MRNPRYEKFLAQADAHRGTVREVEDDLAIYRGRSEEQQARDLVEVCHSGWAMLRARPDREAAIAAEDPPAQDFPEIWARLRARYRSQHGAGVARTP